MLKHVHSQLLTVRDSVLVIMGDETVSFPDFEEPWKNSDATLIVEDKIFYVHQIVLGVASPFFETLFAEAKFAEGTTKTATLKGKTAADVRDLLQVLYPPHKDLTSKCNK